jgi:DNA primase
VNFNPAGDLMNTERVLEDIKSRIDIVDFISDYVHLKKAGQNWKGLCPFHTEKTPSFMVNPSKQIFHCFGCGIGGDVISFLIKYEKLSFHDAKILLAKRAGVTLPVGKVNKQLLEKNEQIGQAYDAALHYFRDQLKRAAEAMDYLVKRGLDKSSIELFQIGYAPLGWGNLLKHLRNKGFSDSIIKEGGLAVSGSKGLYDMFRDRIIFPILSSSGRVIAFGGRALNDAMPKYINSPETLIFRKSDTVFGLYHAKNEIRSRDSAVLVEGYLDVIICHQFGFKNVVAPLGTALTSGQLRKLRTLTNSILLVFDGDTAGKAAAHRALHLVCQNDFKAQVLLLPGGEDPDSYLGKHGAQSFAGEIEKSLSVIDFLFHASDGDLSSTARRALNIIAECGDELVAEEMLLDVIRRTHFSETAVRREFNKLQGKPSRKQGQQKRVEIPRTNYEEFLLLSTLIAYPEKSDHIFSRIDMNDLRDETVVSLFKKIASLKDKQNIRSILDKADDHEKMVFSRLSVNPEFDHEYVDKNIEDCIGRIKKRKLDEKMKVAEKSGDAELSNALLLEKRKYI